LKGAAPKPDFLLKLFPYFAKMGFNAVLMEYEDMFPFDEELASLARKTAYSRATIEEFGKVSDIQLQAK